MSPQEASQTSTTCDVAGPGQQVMGTAAEVAGDAVGNAMGMILQPVLEASIEPVLMSLAPRVAEMTAEKMIKEVSRTCPALADVPNLVEQVTKETSSIMMSFQPELLEYCGDVVRCDMAQGFSNVVIDFMKAIHFGAIEATEVVYSLMPGFYGKFLRMARQLDGFVTETACSACFGQIFPDVLEEVIREAIDLMKDSLRVELKKGNIPPELAELLPWNVIDQLKFYTIDTWEAKQPAPKSGKRHHPEGRDSLGDSDDFGPPIEFS